MELSQGVRNGLLLAGLAIAGALFVLPKLMEHRTPSTVAKTVILKAPAPVNHSDEYEIKQKQEWEAIFDPRSPDHQRANIMHAEEEFANKPNSTNAQTLKSLLRELYNQYTANTQYEKALAVLNRILQVDGSISDQAYWDDKNELALCYLRAGEDAQGQKVVEELLGNVPSKTSAQQHLRAVLDYYLTSDKADDALALVYKMVSYDKQHEWPLFLGYRSFIRLAEEFEDKSMPTKAQEVFDLGLNVEVHRNQPWGQAQIMQRYANFQERRGMKEQAETLRKDARLIEEKVAQADRTDSD